MIRLKKFIVGILFALFLINIDYYVVFANSATSYGSSGDTSFGGPTGGAWTQYGPVNFVGYRVTLVDSSGKKINGTRSVDFAYYNFNSNDVDAITVAEYKNNIRPSNSNNGYNNKSLYLLGYNLINSNYKYRFSDRNNTSDPNNRFGDNAYSDYIMIGSNIIPGKNDAFSSSEFKEFSDKYIQNFSENEVYCPKVWKSGAQCDGSTKVDFIGLFLYYSNYIKTPMKFNLINDNELQKYFLAIEPLFGSASPYMYGTGYEWLNYMSGWESNTTAKGFMENFSNERSSFACSLYTLPGFKTAYPNSTMFENYFESYDSCAIGSLGTIWDGIAAKCTYLPNHICGYSPWKNVYENLKYFRDNESKNASGVALISLNLGGTSIPSTISYDLNLCNDNSVSFNERGNISVMDSDKYYKNEIFNLVDGSDANQGLYCHDDVSFDFNQTVNFLSNTKNLNSRIKASTIPPIVGTVVRTCYNYNQISGMDSDIKAAYNKSIKVNVYGKQYEFKPDFSSSNRIFDNPIGKMARYKYTINYKIESDINLRISDLNGISLNTFNNGYVDFSQFDQIFGASYKLIKTIKNEGNSDLCDNKSYKCIKRDNDITYGLKINGKSDGKCPFQYKVKGNVSNDLNTNIHFRVISLDNPFPARDGTSRLPGKNWLDSDNYVYDYITSNRGIIGKHNGELVSPELIYSELKPMYTVVLTPSTMLKIRNYNMSHSYYSMYNIDSSYKTKVEGLRNKDSSAYKLFCNDNGRECYSSFLRNIFSKSDLTGECVISYDKNDNLVRKKLNQYSGISITSSSIEEDLVNIAAGIEVEYNSGKDLNKNGKIDSFDYLIAKDGYKERNTLFYTCANKTFLSGGPLEGVNN